MDSRVEKPWTVLDGNGPVPAFTGVNDYSECVIGEEELKKSREKNRALVASLGDEFKDLLELINA